MTLQNMRKLFLPPGPILSLTLVGLLLLGVVLYNRAVRLQRFLEPVLAISQPRVTFHEGLKGKFVKEFGGETVHGVRFMGSSIRVGTSLILQDVYHREDSDVLKKLGRVFLETLRDNELSPYVDVILVGTRAPESPDNELNAAIRHEMDDLAGTVLDTLFREVPELEDEFATHFASSSLTTKKKGEGTNWVEFFFIPSERVHVELLLRLEKYVK